MCTPSHVSLTMCIPFLRCFFLASILPFCLASVASLLSTSHSSPLLSPITDSSFSSHLASFLWWNLCQHWHSLHFCPSSSPYFSHRLPLLCLLTSSSLFLSLFSPFLYVSFSAIFSVSLHVGDWNVSSHCWNSRYGLLTEIIHSAKEKDHIKICGPE